MKYRGGIIREDKGKGSFYLYYNVITHVAGENRDPLYNPGDLLTQNTHYLNHSCVSIKHRYYIFN